MDIESYTSYMSWVRPSWSPPPELFGPVWTVLYILIAISFGYMAYLYLRGRITRRDFAPFFLNLVFNLIFTPIQFGLENFVLASLNILLVLATLVWALFVARRIAPWVAYLNIPYLLWVSFATVLQLTITYLNW